MVERILQFLKVSHNFIPRDTPMVCHSGISVCRERSHTETGIQINGPERKPYTLPKLSGMALALDRYGVPGTLQSSEVSMSTACPVPRLRVAYI